MASKNCNKCKELKPLTKFSKHSKAKDGLKNDCKDCHKVILSLYRHTIDGLITVIYYNQKSNSKRRNNSPPSYSKKELSNWICAQPIFEKLFSDWKLSGFQKNLSPSIDRLDDYKGYSFDNIQLTTWQENKDKGYSDRKSGINNKHSKAVIQLTLDGDFIAEYHSGWEASRKTRVSQGNISNTCRGERNSAGGYKWMRKGFNKEIRKLEQESQQT